MCIKTTRIFLHRTIRVQGLLVVTVVCAHVNQVRVVRWCYPWGDSQIQNRCILCVSWTEGMEICWWCRWGGATPGYGPIPNSILPAQQFSHLIEAGKSDSISGTIRISSSFIHLFAINPSLELLKPTQLRSENSWPGCDSNFFFTFVFLQTWLYLHHFRPYSWVNLSFGSEHYDSWIQP